MPTDRNVQRVKCEITGKGWEQWVLLRTDAHHDNPQCNQALEKKHLDEALERNAIIIDAGDLFCAMQGKWDKRSNKSKVRPEHQVDNYLDALVDTAAEFYAPYAANFAAIGAGNHETAIAKHHETDLTQRLCAAIGARAGITPWAGGYTYWVWFTFVRGKQRISRRMWVGHGWGGGGPVTMNTIQAANRMPAMLDGADFIFTGHVHEWWSAVKERIGVNSAGRVEKRPLLIVQGPSYKDEYADGRGGWHVETGKPPKPVGAWWLRFWFHGTELRCEVVRASG